MVSSALLLSIAAPPERYGIFMDFYPNEGGGEESET